jgi:hypothetical protein
MSDSAKRASGARCIVRAVPMVGLVFLSVTSALAIDKVSLQKQEIVIHTNSSTPTRRSVLRIAAAGQKMSMRIFAAAALAVAAAAVAWAQDKGGAAAESIMRGAAAKPGPFTKAPR